MSSKIQINYWTTHQRRKHLSSIRCISVLVVLWQYSQLPPGILEKYHYHNVLRYFA